MFCINELMAQYLQLTAWCAWDDQSLYMVCLLYGDSDVMMHLKFGVLFLYGMRSVMQIFDNEGKVYNAN